MVTRVQILDLFLIVSLFLLSIRMLHYLCANINIDESQTPSPYPKLRSSFNAFQPDGDNPSITTENKVLDSTTTTTVKPTESMGPAQDNHRVLKFIHDSNFILEPASGEYNLEKPDVDPSLGQAQYIRKITRQKRNGFFVEAGALDGETRSNTIYLEKELGWKGLLVEADPNNFLKLKQKGRKCYISNTCLATKPYPHSVNFMQQFNKGKIVDDEATEKSPHVNVVKVQCLPLYSLLAAINVTLVDYFSLNVEGSELKVLKTIPFDKVKIRTLSIQYNRVGYGKQALLDFMVGKRYVKVGEIGPPYYPKASDLIFMHRSVLHAAKLN